MLLAKTVLLVRDNFVGVIIESFKYDFFSYFAEGWKKAYRSVTRRFFGGFCQLCE